MTDGPIGRWSQNHLALLPLLCTACRVVLMVGLVGLFVFLQIICGSFKNYDHLDTHSLLWTAMTCK